MKASRKLLPLLLSVSLLFVSCANLGAGESEEDYVDYFSRVILLTPDGRNNERITTFHAAIKLGDGEMKDVVDYDDYRYIAFEVAQGYTLTVKEFAFFLHTESKPATLTFDFFITDKLPSKVGGNEDPPASAETTAPEDPADTELTEEDVFGDLESYHEAAFDIGTEWDSTHLKFSAPQTVNAGEYIVIRITNNLCTCGEETTEASVPFTFNYLLFYISEVHKN